MSAQSFLHGVEVIELTSGPRPVSTVRSSVIGIVGTAPDADEDLFPLDTPVLISGNRTEVAGLGQDGTLPNALDNILDQAGALCVVVRVDDGASAAEAKANVIGGVDGSGNYKGVHAFKGAKSIVGVQPRILIAPGFTGTRSSGGVTGFTISNGGSGYTVPPTVGLTAPATGGRQAVARAVVTGGVVTAIEVTDPGYGYSAAPTVSFTGGGGGSSAAATATIGTIRDAVVAELQGIAASLRAVIIADCPNTTDAAAIQYRTDFGDPRVFPVDPFVNVLRGDAYVNEPSSSVWAGIICRVDNSEGFWVSPSNKDVFGIAGTARPIDYLYGDINSRANILNENSVNVIIRENGFRTWGNRTCSSDPKWAFLCVRRTADIINDSLQAAHLWAVDRNIDRNYVEAVTESVNAYLRTLKTRGAIINGTCWADPAKNTPDQIAQGKVVFSFDFSPSYPAERVTFESILTNDYLTEIFD